MPFLDNIVTILNNSASSFLSFIPSGQKLMLGISEPIIHAEETTDEKIITRRFPSIINSFGEATMIVPDDTYQMIVYHKLESITNAISAKSGFGDSRGDQLEVANMAMMVIGFRDKVKKQAYELEAIIKDSFPEKNIDIKDPSGKLMQQTAVFASNSSFDKLGLLQREYSEVELNYPTVLFFEIKYRVESRYRKGCINACDC